MGIVDDLIRAHAAFEQQDWAAAYQGLQHTDPAALGVDDLERLATAAYLVGRDADCLRALEQAFHTHLEIGDGLGAARCTFWMAMVLFATGQATVGAGWVARGQRLLDEHDGDAVERGYLMILQMLQHIFVPKFTAAYELAVQITEYGRRFRDPDLLAMGLSSEGRLMMHMGQVREGLTLFDEAMTSIASGAVSPIFAGQVYCSMIEACQEVSDLSRAADWTAALTRWCESQPALVPFTGQCAVHRGQIMSAHGAFRQALNEFALARDRYLAAGGHAAAGLAWAEQGNVLRLLGEYGEAEAAYEHASELGYEP